MESSLLVKTLGEGKEAVVEGPRRVFVGYYTDSLHPVAIQISNQNRKAKFDETHDFTVGTYYDLVTGRCISPGLIILRQDMLVDGNMKARRELCF